MARGEEGEGECASAVENYMEQLEEVVRYSLPRDGRMAAFFAESIQATVALRLSYALHYSSLFIPKLSSFS